jgi:hypothetical protein
MNSSLTVRFRGLSANSFRKSSTASSLFLRANARSARAPHFSASRSSCLMKGRDNTTGYREGTDQRNHDHHDDNTPRVLALPQRVNDLRHLDVTRWVRI